MFLLWVCPWTQIYPILFKPKSTPKASFKSYNWKHSAEPTNSKGKQQRNSQSAFRFHRVIIRARHKRTDISATNYAKSLSKGMHACQHKAMTSHNTSSLKKRSRNLNPGLTAWVIIKLVISLHDWFTLSAIVADKNSILTHSKVVSQKVLNGLKRIRYLWKALLKCQTVRIFLHLSL